MSLEIASTGYVNGLDKNEFIVGIKKDEQVMPMPTFFPCEIYHRSYYPVPAELNILSMMVPIVEVPEITDYDGPFYWCIGGTSIGFKLGQEYNKDELGMISFTELEPNSKNYNVEMWINDNYYITKSDMFGPSGSKDYLQWLNNFNKNGGVYADMGVFTKTKVGTYICVSKPSSLSNKFSMVTNCLDSAAKGDLLPQFQITPYRYSGYTAAYGFKYKMIPRELSAQPKSNLGETAIASVGYVNERFNLSGKGDSLTSKKYADKMAETWPDKYKPYQPNLPEE